MSLARYGASAASLLVSILISNSPAVGQSEQTDTVPQYQLEAVTVTATRTPAIRAQITQRIEVVEANELTRIGTGDLARALRSTIPLDVLEYPGLLAGVSLRGFRPQLSGTPRTLLLVDGRPAGTQNLALVQTDAVERVEVLRGPAASLYGSSAMGGVVNVITRRSTGPPTGELLLDHGSFGGYRLRAGGGGALTSRLTFDVALGGSTQSRGYRTGRVRTFGADSLTKTLETGEVVALPWVSADTTLSFSEHNVGSVDGRIALDLGPSWRIEARGELYRADQVQNPGDLGVRDWDSRTLKDVGRSSFDLSLAGAAGAHDLFARVFRAGETIDYYNAPTEPNFVSFRTPAATRGVQIQDAVRLANGSITFGLDRTLVESRSEAFAADGSRNAPFSPDVEIGSTAVFAQGRLGPVADRVLVTFGGRLDRIRYDVLETPNLLGHTPNREHHFVLNPSLGASLDAAPGVRLYGNAGRAFVTPDPFQVAGYSESRAAPDRRAVSVTRGNPRLRPESSWGWDLGIAMEQADRGMAAEVALFDNAVRDRIVREITPGSAGETTVAGDTVLSSTTFTNADRARIRGIEWRMEVRGAGLPVLARSVRLFVNGTTILEAAEQRVGSSEEKRIPNVARSTAVAGVEVAATERSAVRLTGRYVGERVDADYVEWWAPGEILYPPYLVLDLDAETHLGGRYRLSAGLRNALDEDYFEVRGYNLPGRSAWAGVRVRL